MNKKTDYPDLERLPDHNHLKHFMNWLWNKPRWIFEGFYEKNFLKQKLELETLKIDIETLKIDIEMKELKLTVLRNEIRELRK